MYSMAILLALVVATTNALSCRPVTCMIHCPYGFDVDSQGCPVCRCRQSSNVCLEPISGYNCAVLNQQDCPSTHECQFDPSGLSGRCCLKQSESTKQLPVAETTTKHHTTTSRTRPTTTKHHTTKSTARPTTTKHHTTTSRAFIR